MHTTELIIFDCDGVLIDSQVLQCQVDAAELTRLGYGPSLGAIKRGLDRMYREDGPAEGAGRFVVRVARVLKLDGIVLLETSPTGGFHDALGTGHRISPGDYGDAVRDIDALVLELHRACATRMGKVAA